ncbi:MAG: hypothetical protein HOK60_04995, partial [Planctomycetes bacterium]|nr:hypothetical protein [Planctomycetota bacterium]
MSDLIGKLQQREVSRRSQEVRLEGRVLHLVDDAEAMVQQLSGTDLPLDHGLTYRDN